MGITEISGYRIVRLLGAGGMGQVFLVEHPRLPRQDALKLLDAGVSRNDDFKARFQREADLLAQLSHPNIVTLHDRGEFEDRLWITMEYVAGTDAAELLQTTAPLDSDLAIGLVGGAGAALDYAWRKQRITHRDVKPGNILVGIDDADGDAQIESVKLADFGIAKAAGEATSLTSTGITVGTMQYISPEAIEGEDLDNRADVYSLGCTAFHLLAGQPPYSGSSITALMSAHLTHAPPLISEVGPHLPEAMNSVFATVLAKNPADRYQSCGEFIDALRDANGGAADPRFARTASAATMRTRAGGASGTDEDGKGGIAKSRVVAAIAAVVAVLAVGGVALGIFLTGKRHDAPVTPVAGTSSTTAAVVTTTSARPTTTTTPAPTSVETTPPPEPVITTETTTVAPPAIYEGMPCDNPGTKSPDGRFFCGGENGTWIDLSAPPVPVIGQDAMGRTCTTPGAKGRVFATDSVLTCRPDGSGGYVWGY